MNCDSLFIACVFVRGSFDLTRKEGAEGLKGSRVGVGLVLFDAK